nr:hypothetical protein [uncultured Dyadobacter sp.]
MQNYALGYLAYDNMLRMLTSNALTLVEQQLPAERFEKLPGQLVPG